MEEIEGIKIPEVKLAEQEQNWLMKEIEKTKQTAFNEDKIPALKLEENKVVEMEVDFSKPFEMWYDEENKVTKKLMPVKVGEENFIWWLNVKNPVYHQILEAGNSGQTKFKILQTGSQKNTKYIITK